MKDLYGEAMMGHKTSIQQIYFTPTEDDMVEEYKKAAPKLTITSVVMESFILGLKSNSFLVPLSLLGSSIEPEVGSRTGSPASTFGS